MAFNFNWSPLIADTSRARDMLTNALNKSPKPPIIVDDIIVTELNLGSIPPELEILEIGDLAEDRFRGIFKMSYTGDAYLTLRTRVQANPLNTYLSMKPSFTSPQPLAASSGLTIPLQITLSDIRLSGFVILVFSKQKGITLVFRNDPLESLKVSSTFDPIPFVRDYLQKEIEGQLRVLFMDDLPAIIHRLSLRMTPDYQQQQDDTARAQTEENKEVPIDPLASPPQNPVDSFINPLDDSDLASLSSPEDSHQTHATFSRKNLLRLATLTDSHRTLSLFTPPIRDAVFRAWAGAAERGEPTNIQPLGLSHSLSHGLSSLSRQHSTTTSYSGGSVYSFSDAASGPVSAAGSARPTLSSMTSAYSFNGTGGPRNTRPNRKRKHRVVNLRKPKAEEPPPDTATETSSRPTTPTSTSASASEPREGEMITPPDSPEKKEKTPRPKARIVEPLHKTTSQPEIVSPQPRPASSSNRLQSVMLDQPTGMPREMHEEPSTLYLSHSTSSAAAKAGEPVTPTNPRHRQHRPSDSSGERTVRPKLAARTQSLPPEKDAETSSAGMQGPASGSILEQAWMMKMATEIARKVREEKESERSCDNGEDPGATVRPTIGKGTSFWASDTTAEDGPLRSQLDGDVSPPPAYKA